MDSNIENEDSELAEVETYRQRVYDSLNNVIREQDKQLLTISTAAIGASFGLSSILPEGSKGMLIGPWIMWLICIILVVTSFGVSQLAHRDTLKKIDSGRFDLDRPDNCWDSVLPKVDSLAFVSFVAAMIWFVIVIVISQL